MRKRILSLLLAFILFIGVVPAQANTSSDLKLWVDGDYVETDVPPFIDDGRTLVPVRFVAEALGYEVDWDNDTQTVTIKSADTSINMVIGSMTALHNGNDTTLHKEPIVKDDRTFVPIRDVAERFGKEVDWDQDNRTVIIGAGYVTPLVKNQNTFDEGIVTNVVDGDTIDVCVGGETRRVRLILVDTPETKHPNKGVEYYGIEASEYTNNTLLNKTVYLQKDVSDADRYGRYLYYVWLTRPSTNEPTKEEVAKHCFNSLLLENGYAQLATFPPDVKYVDFFKTRQEIAKTNKYGLWGDGGIDPATLTGEANAPVNNNTNSGGWRDPSNPAYQYADGKLIGNINSMIYHAPGQQGYRKVAYKNAVFFNTPQEAINAGYRAAQR